MLNTTSKQPLQSDYLRQLVAVFSGVDWWLVGATLFLIVVGLTTLKFTGGTVYFEKQLEFVWAGILACMVFWTIPYYFWTNKNVVIALYAINLILLLTVMFIGHSALGAQRWLTLGPITLQPSEIAKLIVIFTLAAWLSNRPIKNFFDILKVAAIIAPPAILVFKQPDLGTSLTFGAVFLGMSFWAGATATDILVMLSPAVSLIMHALNHQWFYIWLGILTVFLLLFWSKHSWSQAIRITLILAVVLANFGCGLARPHIWGMLKDYQQKRLTSFVNPYADPRGSGYHILQSLIAIGGGGINGEGLGHGNQTQGAFIPERHTDFIFAVIGEEMGFKISILVIIAYAIICFRSLKLAYQSRLQPAGSLIAIGVLSLFLFHVFLNIGMTMGIMPVAGVPLPFLSYGGTALIVNLVAIGLLHSITYQNPPPKPDIWR